MSFMTGYPYGINYMSNYAQNYAQNYTQTYPQKFNYYQQNAIGSLKTETHKLNYPQGFNGQINFYDPVTGRPGPVINAMPQIQSYSSNPSGYNVDIMGDPYAVAKIEKELRKKKNKLDIDDNDNDDDENEDNGNGDNDDEEYEKNIDGLNIIDHKKNNAIKHINSMQREKNEWRLMGDYLIHNSLVTSYAGAGVVFLEKSQGEKTLLLGGNKNGVFDDFGGNITFAQMNYTDVSYSLEKSSTNNASTKTAGLFLLTSSLKGFPYVDVQYQTNELYRCYFVELSNSNKISTEDLNSMLLTNKKHHNKLGNSNQTRKHMLARFNFEDTINKAINKNDGGDSTIVDIDDNKEYKMSNKLSVILSALFKNKKNQNLIFGSPKQITLHKNYNGNTGYTRIEV